MTRLLARTFGAALMLTIAIDGVSSASQAAASAQVHGQVRDETGGVLPGVTVELSSKDVEPKITVTNETEV